MIKGIILALSACFMWGFIFVIPAYLIDYSSFEIAIGRYILFGILSLGFLAYFTFYQKKVFPLEVWKQAFVFALIANVVCYTCLVMSVKLTSSSITALIMGVSPLLIMFYGNWIERNVKFKELIIPCLFIAIGGIIIHFPDSYHLSQAFTLSYLLGLVGALIALLTWSWFAVANAHYLKTNPSLRPEEWTTIIGSATFFWVCVMGFIYEYWQESENWNKFYTPSIQLQNFWIGCAILGIVCSWLGAYLWAQSSTILPLTLTGLLSIFETIFGLIFFYILEERFPPFVEVTGVCFILIGVIYAIALDNRRRALHALSEVKSP